MNTAQKEFKDVFDTPCSLRATNTANLHGYTFSDNKALHLSIMFATAHTRKVIDGSVVLLPYELPDGTTVGATMHLNKPKVEQLVKWLTTWLETGKLGE